MSDTELNMILSVEDQISDGAAGARDELSAMAAGPYDGELNITANMDDQASPEIERLSTEADRLEGNATDAADAVESIGKSAADATGDMSQLAQSQEQLAASSVDSAAAASDSSTALSDAGSAATTADVSVRGAAGGMRALTSVAKTVGGAAGASTASLAEMSVGMRMVMMTTRLAHGGLQALGGLLMAIPGWGWVAAAAAVAFGAAWKSGNSTVHNAVQGMKDHFMSSMSAMKNTLTGWIGSVGAAGAAVNAYSQRQGFLNNMVGFAATQFKTLGSAVQSLLGVMAQEGALHNAVTGAIEREQASEVRLKSAIDASKTAHDNYKAAALAREAADTRIATSATSAERANISLQSATLAAGQAQSRLATLQASGTASADDLQAATIDVASANLSVTEASQAKDAAMKDSARSSGEAKDAADKEKDAFAKLMDSSNDLRKATDDNKRAQDDLKTGLNDLQAAVDSMNANGYAAFADEAVAQLDRVKEAQAGIDPTLRHSPSLVDRVETGINDIMGHYKRLGDQAGVMPSTKSVPVIVNVPTQQGGAGTVIQTLNIHPPNGSTYTSIMRDLENSMKLNGSR